MSLPRIILIIVILAVISGLVWFVVSRNTNSVDTHSGIHVVTTLFPTYDMVRAIGGQYTDVSLLLPPGTEPHSFEPTPADIAAIGSADVFVYTGPFMEPWVTDILSSINNPHLIVVNASAHITLLTDDDEDAAEHGGVDPHMWLDTDNATTMATDIATALSSADPAHAQAFADNLATYTKELSTIDTGYNTGLSSCATRTLVYGGHYAFGYMAHRYGLTYVAAQGFSPDAEPTASDIASLVDTVRTTKATSVFYSGIENPSIAQTIAAETGATLRNISPAGSIGADAFTSGTTFFDILRANLIQLRAGLSCN